MFRSKTESGNENDKGEDLVKRTSISALNERIKEIHKQVCCEKVLSEGSGRGNFIIKGERS